ncbi:response regulator transcription factor [Chloroflexota bacterium]
MTTTYTPPASDLMSKQDPKKMDMTRVLTVDDHILIRRGLGEALAGDETLEVVGEASDGNEAVEKAMLLKPHVVLMDLHMPNCTGVEAAQRLQVEMPEARVLMLTVSDGESDLLDAIKAGARGYILKNENPDMIIQAIHYVACGGLIVSPSMAAILQKEFGMERPAVKTIESSLPVEATMTERAVAEPPTYELYRDTPEPAQDEIVTERRNPNGLSRYDLVISHPLEPSKVLQLHRWLKDVAKDEIDRIIPSFGGDTLLAVAHRGSTPLSGMLAGLPMVAEVSEEPCTGEMGAASEDPPSINELQETDAPPMEYKRLRLVLQAG